MLDFFRARPRRRTVKIRPGGGVLITNPTGWRKITFYLANGLFVFCLFYLVYLYTPLLGAVIKYEVRKVAGPKETNTAVAIPTPEPTPTGVSQPEPDDFWIQIPKILANSRVIKNVSPFDKEEYLKVLESGAVAQADVSNLPGEGPGKTTFIFAHSTNQGVGMARNNAVFYLLGELGQGDVVYVGFKGKIYIYQVNETRVVRANEVQYLSYTEPDKEMLILQTCWPIGTDWKRLLVMASRQK
ncbi:MAG: sortase [Candidatus Shapirobacteria bacterium]|jgi:LPXTG-site transpeptidase (sortase) family protein